MQKTNIGWTDYSVNPLKYRDTNGRVRWACAKVSAGCTNCYSEALAKRWSRGADYNAGEVAKLTPYLDEKELHQMRTSKKLAGTRVFVGDMTDVFGEWVPDELLDRLFTTFAERPDVTWQVLTKRAERMRAFLSDGGRCPAKWPLPNVWLGVSCEDQTRADERIPHLLNTPASVRFISAEPLIGAIDLHGARYEIAPGRKHGAVSPWKPSLDWVIVGGESGPRFRDCRVGWIEVIVRDTQHHNVPVFVKQDAHRLPGQPGRIPAEYFVQQFPVRQP